MRCIHREREREREREGERERERFSVNMILGFNYVYSVKCEYASSFW